MRTIKFRGKRTEDNRFVYGDLIQYGNQYCSIRVNLAKAGEIPNYVEFLVYIETLGQFTGLVDKNGIEIYEGDYLKGFEYPVTFEDGSFCATIQYDLIRCWLNSDNCNLQNLEVVGNVIDNQPDEKPETAPNLDTYKKQVYAQMTESGHIATNSDNQQWVYALIQKGVDYRNGELERYLYKENEHYPINPRLIVVGGTSDELIGILKCIENIPPVPMRPMPATYDDFVDQFKNISELVTRSIKPCVDKFHISLDEKGNSQQGWKSRPKHKR
jgi:hypothetical protein